MVLSSDRKPVHRQSLLRVLRGIANPNPATSDMTKTHFDYLVIGGGTAGAIVAARLAEDPSLSVCLVEAGYSDEGVPGILELRPWADLLRTQYDYDYTIEPQARGNSAIRHSRGRILGGCSSHNSAIAFRAPDSDFERWQASGATGWGPEGTRPYYERLFEQVNLEPSGSGNLLVKAFIEAGQQAGFPLVSFQEDFQEAVGWFLLNKRGSKRDSSSVAYLHPLSAQPSNLTVLTLTPTHRILVDDSGRATGVDTAQGTLTAEREIILCCGAFDSPKLLLLSGIGPADQLRALGIPVVVELPGVGENLIDHPEGVLLFESAQPVPRNTSQAYEAGLFARVDSDATWPDLMLHFGSETFDLNTKPLGYPTAQEAFSLTPNVTHARSQGVVRLRSADPSAPPLIDPRYFTDPEGYDEHIMVAGLKLARELAAQPALKTWVKQELAPGPAVQSDREISEYVRRTGNTVYHPAGTCRMGAAEDPLAVVDPTLRVRGVSNLRVADASIFPSMTGVNPCITCMMIGEKCADLLRGG